MWNFVKSTNKNTQNGGNSRCWLPFLYLIGYMSVFQNLKGLRVVFCAKTTMYVVFLIETKMKEIQRGRI